MPSYGYEWILDSKKVNIISSHDGQIYENKWEAQKRKFWMFKNPERKKKTSMIFLADQETRNKMKTLQKSLKSRHCNLATRT